MADPRFYDNRGPFSLARLCARISVALPESADPDALVFDLAGLAQAGPAHLSFYDSRRASAAFLATSAGWCLVKKDAPRDGAPAATVLLPCLSVSRAFAILARLFYPEHELGIPAQETAIHPSARLGQGVVLAPHVVIGPNAEIGARTKIGAHAAIGRGVTIGRDCEIGPQASIAYAHLGDEVVVQSGARIGGSGFGFSSAPDGHFKIPQLGRVIVQDRVEIGANSAIDRGALADSVIGEGTKIDNLVQIGHNTVIGRHCILVAQVGISGSVAIGDGVVLGGMVGVADHVAIGDGARLAAKSGVTRSLEGGREYGGFPARPVREWRRETVMLGRLVKRDKRTNDE